MTGWMSTALIVAACILVGATLCAIWWWVPKLQMRRLTFENDKDRAATEDNFRKTVGQVIGGAAVLVGAVLAYLQFSQQQDTAAKEALRQQVASRNTLKTSQDLLISNQVAKGFEQLAGDKIAMRLGGIYALEGVMNTSEQYHQPVLEALCAFVRDSTRDVKGDAEPATDVQAALTVIGRRAPGHLVIINLAFANISGADLFDAHLNTAFLRHVRLDDAILAYADLRGANLKDTSLKYANLKSADLRGAALDRADLDGADLLEAKLDGQAQLDQACGTGVKLPPGLTLKPCP